MKRVYLIDLHKILPGTKHNEFTNEEWMHIAEVQGTVYSLSGFQTDYNTNGLDSVYQHSAIRFI